MSRPEVLIVAGPTASGKSGLALALAERFGGTVINADSMQVYADLAVLTARPPASDLARVPHALYGVLDSAELCSAARWAAMARQAIEDSIAGGRLPILCGGTGLYIRTLLHGIAPVPAIPEDIRGAARALHAALGGEAFRAELATLDPEAASRLNTGDGQRLIRAFEVVKATGRTLADWQRAGNGDGLGRAVSIWVLLPPRETLYQAIDTRFEHMIEAGGLDEVRRLLARDLDPALPVMKAVGVPELASHLRGECSLADAVAQAQLASRRYAKRQYTWFRHQLPSANPIFEQFSERNAGQVCQIICKGA